MKLALRNNNSMLHLDKISRESLQAVYEDSVKGKLCCAHCHEEVRLYLGIQKAPHFYHAVNSTTTHPCAEAVAEMSEAVTISPAGQQNEAAAAVEVGGFQLPKGRSISSKESTPELQSLWKPALMLSGLPSFKKSSHKPVHVDDRYFETLRQHGVHLDDEQWQAVSHTEGPLLIFAGAGSGKTRVLTARTAYMIAEKGIAPASIMLVTFTTKAAAEMRKRIASYPGLSGGMLRSLVSGTFHSIFYKMLLHHEPEKWQAQHLLKWDWQKEKIVKEAGRELGLDEKEFPYDQTLQQISYWKNARICPTDIRPKDLWEERSVHLYKHYEKVKAEKKWFDFDDMLSGCYELLTANEELLQKYQERFQYFLIDEFQDINKIQYDIMKLLSARSKNLCVVGDDDQSIYGFRGSDPAYILNFALDFPGTSTVTLDQNYRSAHPIVAAANETIQLNKQRKPKQMHAQYDADEAPLLFYPYDEEEEATMIVTDLKERIQQGAKPANFAVLYRTHSASRALFERLSQSNLPFVVDRDAESFYERRMIRTMLAYMRLSLNNDDVKAMSDLLSALFIKQAALQDLKAATILEDCTLVEALLTLKGLHAFQQKKLKKIVTYFPRLKGLSPLAAIHMIENDMGFNDFIKKQGNEGNAIEKGSDEIRDLKVVAKKFSTIAELLAHADHMTAMTEEMKKLGKTFENAIQLTTIHRSKGLEYEHVYVLSAVDGGIPHDYALEASRNGDHEPLEEERRLMYVAMTRAKQTLSLSIPTRRRGKSANPSRFLRQLIRSSTSNA